MEDTANKFEFMLGNMLKLAHECGVEPTENVDKIARARMKMGIPISVCPCHAKDTDRGCISPKCLQEINEKGICCCQCYRRRNGELNKGSSAL